jgi:hypothetical protein
MGENLELCARGCVNDIDDWLSMGDNRCRKSTSEVFPKGPIRVGRWFTERAELRDRSRVRPEWGEHFDERRSKRVRIIAGAEAIGSIIPATRLAGRED